MADALTTCKHCRAPFEPTEGRGRPRNYCSGRCRARAYMARHYDIDLLEVVERWGTDCYLCGDVVDIDAPFGPEMPNVDHVVPLSRGGITHPSNLRVVHYRCNLRKADHLVCPHCRENL